MAPEQDPERRVRPISPDEVSELQLEQIPSAVFETFNRMIGELALNGCATIRQQDVVDALIDKGLNKQEIFRRGWLNIEGLYREAGWEVEYDKPAYNETYEPLFKFSSPRRDDERHGRW